MSRCLWCDGHEECPLPLLRYCCCYCFSTISDTRVRIALQLMLLLQPHFTEWVDLLLWKAWTWCFVYQNVCLLWKCVSCNALLRTAYAAIASLHFKWAVIDFSGLCMCSCCFVAMSVGGWVTSGVWAARLTMVSGSGVCFLSSLKSLQGTCSRLVSRCIFATSCWLHRRVPSFAKCMRVSTLFYSTLSPFFSGFKIPHCKANDCIWCWFVTYLTWAHSALLPRRWEGLVQTALMDIAC